MVSTPIDIDGLRRRYIAECPYYLRLARQIGQIIEESARDKKFKCNVEHRAKEVRSLVAKALTKKYADPYDEIGDKAGVRVVVDFPWERNDLEEMIASLFCVLERDDKRVATEPDRFGYRATHFQVKHPRAPKAIRDLECEIQVMTKSESLWADTTHDLSYKSAEALPPEIQRIYHRLVSLTELFDLEVERARRELDAMPKTFGAQLLNILLPHHQRFVGQEYDAELSEMVLDFLGEHVISDSMDVVGATIDNFIANNSDKIQMLLGRRIGDDNANPLVWQPELFVILSQLETNKFVLQAQWPEILPESLLLSLADDWGVRITPIGL
ncbi:MAG: hypothetical protein OXI54_08685 [Chloroflexota bacterium]|nr:hypothetical protein [Chloroflexota bacterium]